MAVKQVQLPYPTGDMVKSYIQKFDQAETVVESALQKLFSLFPDNTAVEEVFLKVVVLNDLYGTFIWDKRSVAQHIVSLGIDSLIRDGQISAVELIARIQVGDKTRKNYSFATKYCAWHNPAAYPIYDAYVGRMLWTYGKQDQFDTFYRYELEKYERFFQIITNFRTHYHLKEFELKDLDKFLWRAGKDYFPSSWS